MAVVPNLLCGSIDISVASGVFNEKGFEILEEV
jgi:hypothetical protein